MLEINPKEAIRFLDLIDGHQSNHHFQTFNDRKDANAATTEEGALDPLMIDKLTVSNKHGGGIFVAINSHQQKKRRLKKTTERINAIFADFDDAETARDSMLKAVAVLPATIVVESSPSKFHVYWVLATSGSIAVDDFYRWQKQLANTYGSDPKIVDTTRVMRMPGFIHQKSAPFITRIVDEYTTGNKYSIDDLVSAFYGGRNNWLTSIAGSLRREARPHAEIIEKLNSYNQSLAVPLDEEEIERVAGNMANYSPDPVMEKSFNVGQLADQLGLETDKRGVVIPNYRNTVKVVGHENVVTYNLLANCMEVKLPVSWERRGKTAQWVDSDTNMLQSYLSTKYDTDWPSMYVSQALDVAATHNQYDPLLNYLNSCQWDGKPRIRSVFQEFMGVDDNPYTSAVAEVLFVGAVKRAFEPGCQFPTMVVIVGEEGGGKSKFPSVIAKFPEFYTDSVGDIKNVRDAAHSLQGNWIVEFPEMKALMGASNEHTKAFISAQVDKIRLPYGRLVDVYPRRCVFIGSTNNEQFLTDDGANRRYLPIYSPHAEERGQVLDYKKLASVVDLLWAEAVDMYKKGHDARMPDSLTSKASEQRLTFTESGGYEESIIAYMMDDAGAKVNGAPVKRTAFRSRDFFLSIDGNTPRMWGANGSAIQNSVANAARKVFALPEWSKYKYGRYETSGVRWRGWKLIENKNEESGDD